MSDSADAAPAAPASKKRSAAAAELDDARASKKRAEIDGSDALCSLTQDVEALIDSVVDEAVANITVCGYGRLFESLECLDNVLTHEIDGMSVVLPHAKRLNELTESKMINTEVILTDLKHRLQVHYAERALLTGEPDIALAVLRAMFAQSTCGLSQATLEQLATLARGGRAAEGAPDCINLSELSFAGATIRSDLLASLDRPVCFDCCDMRGVIIEDEAIVKIMARRADWDRAYLHSAVITGDVSHSTFVEADVTALAHNKALNITGAHFIDTVIHDNARASILQSRTYADYSWPMRDDDAKDMLHRLHPTK
jgi:hypothetical protein